MDEKSLTAELKALVGDVRENTIHVLAMSKAVRTMTGMVREKTKAQREWDARGYDA